jgi:uncharacterized protein YciI
VPYYLVLLHPVPGSGDRPDHEPFVDWLDTMNLVLLGGDFEPAASGAEAAYVLSCASKPDAHELVAADPLVSSGCMRADVVEWHLVGVDPEAVGQELRRAK